MLGLLARFGLPVWVLPLIGFALGSAGGGWLAYKVMDAKVARMEAGQAAANARAVAEAASEQKRIDDVAMKAAVAQAEAQRAEQVKTVTITKWAYKNVASILDCPSPDLVRLHDAAAIGADPENVVLDFGKPDDRSAAIEASRASAHNNAGVR